MHAAPARGGLVMFQAASKVFPWFVVVNIPGK